MPDSTIRLNELAPPHALALLVGENPLPNYVAAQLLAQPETKIWLFYSDETTAQMQTLQRILSEKGFPNIESVQMPESNPVKIRDTVSNKLKHAHGVIHLNYTGGTKAMAVHAMRALSGQPIFSSYLDARHLQLWVVGPGITGEQAIDVSLRVPVMVQEVLSLHGWDTLDKPMRRGSDTFWLQTLQALAEIHTDIQRAQAWRTWCNEILRRKDRRDKFHPPGALKAVQTLTLDAAVANALAADLGRPIPETLGELFTLAPVGSLSDMEDLARWLDGSWQEHYTLHQLGRLRDTLQLCDIAMSIEPHFELGTREKFEFDIAAMRGYRLFAISCTTSHDASLCKAKLLEAVVRARQLGGAEARIGLVCCSDDPRKLELQVQNLTQSQQLKVFGRADLLKLGERLEQWISYVSKE